MAAEVPKTISLKLLVDKEKNRVVFAEADSHFVDVLFSFLTLPVGTVLRLLSKQSPQLELGSMHNLHRSVENLEGEHFWNDICKTMLLHTRNSSADICRKLKVNVDDTEPIKYYMCPNFSDTHGPALLSTFCDAPCGCGRKLTKEMSLTPPGATVDQEKGVFLNAGESFIVTDDLQVMPMSAETTLGLLHNCGARAEALEVKTVDVTHEQVSRLLKNMLICKASLTETFLVEQREVLCRPKFEETHEIYLAKKDEIGGIQKINLNVIVQKSNNKILCAEAGVDFVSFLMSILTCPLGAVVKLLDGDPTLGSISTLYKSVEGLSVDKYMKSEQHGEMLLSPKLALQHSCKYHQLLDIGETTFPSYFYNFNYRTSPNTSLTTTNCYSWSTSRDMYSRELKLIEIEGFVSMPTTFMVTNDLGVAPFSSMSTITMLKQIKVPIDDVEMQVLSIGHFEALQILGASMKSKTVLTTLFKSTSRKKIKEEIC